MFSRLKSPTPKFFKNLAKVGGVVVAVGTAIITAPVAIPAAIVGIGSYLIVGGSVILAVAPLAKKEDE